MNKCKGIEYSPYSKIIFFTIINAILWVFLTPVAIIYQAMKKVVKLWQKRKSNQI